VIVALSLSILTAIHPVPPPSLPSVPTLEINCLLDGDDASHVFPVKISSNECVGALRKAIKEEKKPALDHVTADSLKVWRVSIPDDAKFAEALANVKLKEEEALSPMETLSRTFSNVHEAGRLQVIVKSPRVRECTD